MKVQTYFSAAEVDVARVADATAVVIDVIRATTTIVEALQNGAHAFYPSLSTEEALRLATSLGRDETLLCGERKGLKVEGFDLGNSPREFTEEAISGKRLVMSTTNGTRAFLAAAQAERVLAASFTNLSAVARALSGDADPGEEGTLVFICAGKEGRFSLDDALCAGCLLDRLVQERGEEAFQLSDGALASLTLARAYPVTRELLEVTAAGAALVEVGLGDDLPLCAEVDRHDLVPEMHDRMIHLPDGKR